MTRDDAHATHFVEDRSAQMPPTVLTLENDSATQSSLVGNKAAHLSKAQREGMPVLPGFVITVPGVHALTNKQDESIHSAWAQLSNDGQRPLIVRSSSAFEDREASAMAGAFATVLRVEGWKAFREAVRAVVESAKTLGLGNVGLAVLVQPHLDISLGGVLFTADPVNGENDRIVVSMVSGSPDELVAGGVSGTEVVLSRRGRLLSHQGEVPSAFQRSTGRALARLARRATRLFNAPQDIEWALDNDGKLWLLQSRAITTLHSSGKPTGPLLGPGPVAETFPDPLMPLEQDLWIAPLKDGIRHALRIAGAVSERRLRRSPIIQVIQGRVAVDLELLGAAPVRHPIVSKLNPQPAFRRLGAAWQVGRLRAALPQLAGSILRRIDHDLQAVPALDSLSDRQLVSILSRGREALVSLHGYEILTGLLLDANVSHASQTGASIAASALREGRQSGLDDEHILRRDPVVLMLVPPRLGGRARLPEQLPVNPLPERDTRPENSAVIIREALRVRIRWVQELTSRATGELADRLVAQGAAPDFETIQCSHIDHLDAAVEQHCPIRTILEAPRSTPPLPAMFRLTVQGEILPVHVLRPGTGGQGAGGGRAMGPAYVRTADTEGTPPQGSVLVVSTLDPQLASWLPGLAGLVAETGSPLSHLAIMAREHGVATAVGVDGATRLFKPGQLLVVDGATGAVIPARQPTEDVS